jgi:hypothetical protein
MRRGQDVPDFKAVNRVIAGELGDPKAVPEDGEFEETTLSDGKEAYKLTVWGQMVSHSWQLIVNDRLNAFMELPPKMGNAMKRKMNRLAYQRLKDNPTMPDSGRAVQRDGAERHGRRPQQPDDGRPHRPRPITPARGTR